jgi:thioesterase domain-containing protein
MAMQSVAMLELRNDRPLFGLQPQASEHSALMHRSRGEMVAYCVARIRILRPRGADLLGGLCAGGALAFNGSDNGVTAASLLGCAAFVEQKVLGFSRYQLVGAWQEVWSTLKVRVSWWLMSRNQAPPEALRRLTLQEIYRTVRNNSDRHAVLRGSALLFRATRGDGSAADEPFLERFDDPYFGWRERLVGELVAVELDGGHSTMVRAPHMVTIANAIGAWLNSRSTAAVQP